MLIYPNQTYANIFSDLVNKVLGTSDKTAEASLYDDNEVVHNSQSMALLEPSLGTNIKAEKDTPIVNIIDDQALIASNGPLGPADDIEKYASSSERIDIYKVKKGDTIEGIIKKFKMPKETLFYLNADLRETDLLQIGQNIVILQTKDQPVVTKEPVKKVTTEAPKETKKEDVVMYTFDIDTKVPVDQPQNVSNNEPNQQNGQSGAKTTKDGYIWPFPEGSGRISQGIHSDQAYDFAAPKGTPIYAIYDGTVLVSRSTGYNGGYGLYVVINFTDGRQAIFGHMSKVVAKAGDTVKQGDLIGYVGSTGKSTGPHVHIGFRGSLPNPYLGLKVNSNSVK